MPIAQFDFLIIGQGLAGSILAYELINRGQRVLVLDNDHSGSASNVAAGIINPITGHRLNLSNNFVQLYTRAKEFYASFETKFGTPIFTEIDQVRLIKNPGQADYFSKRLAQHEYQDFLQKSLDSHLFKKCPFGTASIKQTAIVDTKLLLKKIQAWLIDHNSYQTLRLDYSTLKFKESNIQYEHINAKNIIFCEGYQAINNPWLKTLPFKLAKGEILTVEQFSDSHPMLSWGNWLTPANNGVSKLGSNYAWQDIQLDASSDVKQKLLESLKSQTHRDANVVKHEVGIRPTTTHRHAFIGNIKALSNAYCFNGFGSKGCLTIPMHADVLCDHLLNSIPLPEELSRWL